MWVIQNRAIGIPLTERTYGKKSGEGGKRREEEGGEQSRAEQESCQALDCMDSPPRDRGLV